MTKIGANTKAVRGRRLEVTAVWKFHLATLVCCMGGGAFAQELDCTEVPLVGADEYEICDLGVLDGGSNSSARGVSADGTVVVGNANSSLGASAFRWVQGTGMADIGTLGGGYISANGVNADGSVVVGRSDVGGSSRAFRWVEGSGMTDIGTLAGRQTAAEAVNADGTVVVGWSDNYMDGMRAFRWTESGGMERLDGGWSSRAYGVNADGTVVVGDNYSGWTRAFRWVEGVGMQTLGTLIGGNNSYARGVSADGSVVVGYGDISGGSMRAFRWTDSSGMENLGTLEGGSYSQGIAVNADGSVVVGASHDGVGTWAFRWVEGVGMQSLGGLAGASYSSANAVSADGSIVVGESITFSEDMYDMGTSRAFIWRAAPAEDTEVGDTDTGDVVPDPPSGGTMEDFVNLTASIPILGNDSAVAQAEQQFALGQTMNQRGFAQAGQMVMSAQAGSENTGRNPTTVGARNSSVAAISLGRGISDTVTLGATVSLTGTSLKNNAFDMETGVGGALWGQYRQGGADRTGLQFSGAVGYIQSEGEVARGRLLTDVVLATGTSTVKTRAVQASVGHGLEHGDWLVTSSFGMAHYDTRRAAYTESGASFNASYEEMRTSRTVATLGVTGEFDISENGRLSLGVGVDHEINPERPRLSGTSDIPGLATFDIDSTFTANQTREFATIGYTHSFENGSSISGNLRIGKAVYGTTKSVGVGVAYDIRF